MLVLNHRQNERTLIEVPAGGGVVAVEFIEYRTPNARLGFIAGDDVVIVREAVLKRGPYDRSPTVRDAWMQMIERENAKRRARQ